MNVTQRLVPYSLDAPVFSAPPLGWVLHVQQGNGSPYNVFATAVTPNRRFSHYWIGKDGSVEQYQTRDRQAWAQAAGNATYYSVETEGFVTEPLTSAQIASLAELHISLSIPDTLANAPGERGIGTHAMGGIPWGDHPCPGDIRTAQRNDILAHVAVLRTPASTVEDPDMIAAIRLLYTIYLDRVASDLEVFGWYTQALDNGWNEKALRDTFVSSHAEIGTVVAAYAMYLARVPSAGEITSWDTSNTIAQVFAGVAGSPEALAHKA